MGSSANESWSVTRARKLHNINFLRNPKVLEPVLVRLGWLGDRREFGDNIPMSLTSLCRFAVSTFYHLPFVPDRNIVFTAQDSWISLDSPIFLALLTSNPVLSQSGVLATLTLCRTPLFARAGLILVTYSPVSVPGETLQAKLDCLHVQ